MKVLTLDQLIELNAQLAAEIALHRECADEHLAKMIPLVNQRLQITAEISRRARVPKKGPSVVTR